MPKTITYELITPASEDTVFGNNVAGDNVRYSVSSIVDMAAEGSGNLQSTLGNGNSAIFTDEDGTITEISLGGEEGNRYLSISIWNGVEGEEGITSLIYLKNAQAYLQSQVGLNNGVCGLSEDGIPKMEVTYNDSEAAEGLIRLTPEPPIAGNVVNVKVQSDKPSGEYFLQPESNKSNVYKAILSQTGSGDPTSTVFSTDFPAAIVWTRVETGVYRGALAGAFGIDKTFVPPIQITGQGNSTTVDKQDANYIEISTFDSDNNLSDDLLNATEIYIQVYNLT